MDADAMPPLLEVVQPCQYRPSWIDIVLVDAEGRPVPGARYQVEAPDGTRHEGTLDADGCATVRDMDPGTATVRFPDYHDADFEPELPTPCACERTTWIEIELLDDAGEPTPGARYEVLMADGELCEGSLDGTGRARIEAFDDGPCVVRFPDLEQGACDLGVARSPTRVHGP